MSSPTPVDATDARASTRPEPGADPFAAIVGQARAVAFLRAAVLDPVHAYMLVGPRGSGKRALARSFAAGLLAACSDGHELGRTIDLALAEQHPDVLVVEREGAAISVGQAEEIVRQASLSPTESDRKVLVLDEFHLVAPAAAAKLLKTIEEPPAGTFFVVLAEEVTPDLVTIASRCVQVALDSLPADVVADALVDSGVDRERALSAAGLAQGDLGRARLLATDDRLGLRLALWQAVPGRLDGRGSTAITLVDELRATIDDAEAPLRTRQSAEIAELNERIERYGQRGSGAAQLEKRHRREARRLRADELQLGLATIARAYRDEMQVAAMPQASIAAIAAVQAAAEGLIFNPNEELLLLGLLLALPPIP